MRSYVESGSSVATPANMTADSHPDSQRRPVHRFAPAEKHALPGQPASDLAVAGSAMSPAEKAPRTAKVPRAERLAQLGLRFTKGLPENIRELVRARPTGFRYTL